MVAGRGDATSAHDPTAPSASADPGLVLVRAPDRRGLEDERKGWIMNVKLTDSQVVMLSAAARVKCRGIARSKSGPVDTWQTANPDQSYCDLNPPITE